ncbi:ribonuclease H-like domain-containing protein [Tanacetum coccineum]
MNLLNFFDNTNGHTLEIPNDDEREHSNGDGNVMTPKNINSSHLVDKDATFATSLNDNNIISKGQQSSANSPRSNNEGQSNTNIGDEPQTLRKSNRVRNFLFKFNDYVVPSNKKYGIEKYVNYSKLSGLNMCFTSNLNKSWKPKSYQEVVLDKNWVEPMNNEMEALLKQAPRQWNEKLTSVLNENRFVHSINDYSLFVKHNEGVILILLVYVDDIVVTGNSLDEIEKFKKFLASKFQIKDLGSLKYFVGSGVQFFHGNKLSLHAYSDADCAKSLISRKPVSGFCVYFYGNLVSWKSKKPATISKSSAEAEYRCMASTTCEIFWLVNLLKDQGVEGPLLVPLYCDSTSSIQIIANPIFHESLFPWENKNHFKILCIW